MSYQRTQTLQVNACDLNFFSWGEVGSSIACLLVFPWVQNGITMSHCPPQSARQMHHSQHWHCSCNHTGSCIPRGMFLIIPHLPTNRHSITHHYQQMWWQHPTAQEYLAPCGPQSARPTEFHKIGSAQTSCIQPRHITDGFHIIRQLKKPFKGQMFTWDNEVQEAMP
jgi:hypothetical protein